MKRMHARLKIRVTVGEVKPEGEEDEEKKSDESDIEDDTYKQKMQEAVKESRASTSSWTEEPEREETGALVDP